MAHVPQLAMFLSPTTPHNKTLLDKLADKHTTLTPIRHNVQEWVPHTNLTDDTTAMHAVPAVLQAMDATHPLSRQVVQLQATNKHTVMDVAARSVYVFHLPPTTTPATAIQILLEALDRHLVKMMSYIHKVTIPKYVHHVANMDTQHTVQQVLTTLVQTIPDNHPDYKELPPRSLHTLHTLTSSLPQQPPRQVTLSLSAQEYTNLEYIRRAIPEDSYGNPHTTVSDTIEWLVQQSPKFQEYLNLVTKHTADTADNTTSEDVQ